MRILFLAWNFPPAKGGIEYVAWHLVLGLRRAGDDVRVIARHDPHPEGEDETLRPSRNGLVTYLGFAFVRAWRMLRRLPADLIVCPGIVTAPIAWVLAKVHRKPYVVLAHGSDVTHGGVGYRAAMRFLFRAARGVASNSRSTAALMKAAGCTPRFLQVIHPGVQTTAFPPMDAARREALRKVHGLSERRVLFSLGRLIRRKGILEFVEHVMPALSQAIPDILLVVVGGDATDSLVHNEGMLAQLRQQIAQRGLEHYVRLLGPADDATVHELHYAADIHILPALRMKDDVEGFGIVLIEAALAQVPVVASRTGGIPEAVIDGETGLLVDAEDWDAMLRAIRRLLHDSDLRLRLGRQGRQRALSRFDWPRIVGEYRTFFSEVVADGNGKR